MRIKLALFPVLFALALGPSFVLGQDGDSKKPAPAKKPNLPAGQRVASKLFPFKKDQVIHYSMEVSKIAASGEAKDKKIRKYTLEVRQGADDKINNKVHQVLEYLIDGELRQREYFLRVEGNIACARRIYGPKEHARPFEITEPQTILKSTLTVNDEWKWSGKIGKTPGSSVTKVLEEVYLKIGEKSYPCVVVQMTFDGKDESKGVSKRWYSPDVGLVKEVIEVKTPTEGFKTEILFKKADTAKKK